MTSSLQSMFDSTSYHTMINSDGEMITTCFLSPRDDAGLPDKFTQEQFMEVFIPFMHSQQFIEVKVSYKSKSYVSSELFETQGSLSAYTQAQSYAHRTAAMLKDDIEKIVIQANRVIV